jgi:hypothetical protein
MEEIDLILNTLEKHNMTETKRHFTSVLDAIKNESWEAANSQMRSFIESLFNFLAKTLLDTDKTGGDARKKLEEKGYIKQRYAEYLKSFTSWVGEDGSHAGTSDKITTTGKWFGTLSVALIGISLIPDLIRVEDILQKLDYMPGKRPPRDSEILITCPTCKTQQTLGQAHLTRSSDEFVYKCVNGCQAILIIGKPGDALWEGRGYGLQNYVIRPASDLLVPIIDIELSKQHGKSISVNPPLLFPASPAALMKKRPPH